MDPGFYLFVDSNLQSLLQFSSTVKKLGDLLVDKTRRGKSPAKEGYLDNGIPIIKTANITDTFVDWDDCSKVSERFYLENINAQPLPFDLMLSSTGVGSVGKVDIFDEVNKKCVCSAKISIIHPNKQAINPYYLLVYLRSIFGKSQMVNSARGATGQVELYASDIEQILVPIPSIEVQEKIAERVTDARHKWSTYCQSLSTSKQIFNTMLSENFTKSITSKTYTICSSDLQKRLDADFYKTKNIQQNSKNSSLKMVRLREIASAERGLTPTRNDYAATGVKVIKTASLTGKGLNRKFGHISHNYDASASIKVHKDDLVIASTGAGSIGKADIYNQEEVALSVAELTILPVSDLKIDPYYLYLFFNSELGRSQLEQASRGSTGQQHLYIRDLLNILVPIPLDFSNLELKSALELARVSLAVKSEAEESILKVINDVQQMIASKNERRTTADQKGGGV